MSFILDALKKSEGDRQRQAGPGLFELRVAPPRPRFPLWSIVVAALLGVNALVFGGWLVVRASRSEATATPAQIPVVAASVAPSAVTAGAGALSPAATSPGAALPANPYPQALTSEASVPAVASRMPEAARSAPRDPELAALDATPDAGVERADLEPAIEAPAARGNSFPGVRTQSTGLPTRDELHSPAIASLPELRLDLHVYDADPARRFVLINMHRLHEGDSLPEGVRVDRITEEGAELDYQGTRFLLPHE
jgi:general secretion pathway protein B